jgi:hypothetical protein
MVLSFSYDHLTSVFLLLLFWDSVLLSYYVAENALKLTVLPSQPPECQDYKHVPPCNWVTSVYLLCWGVCPNLLLIFKTGLFVFLFRLLSFENILYVVENSLLSGVSSAGIFLYSLTCYSYLPGIHTAERPKECSRQFNIASVAHTVGDFFGNRTHGRRFKF